MKWKSEFLKLAAKLKAHYQKDKVVDVKTEVKTAALHRAKAYVIPIGLDAEFDLAAKDLLDKQERIKKHLEILKGKVFVSDEGELYILGRVAEKLLPHTGIRVGEPVALRAASKKAALGSPIAKKTDIPILLVEGNQVVFAPESSDIFWTAPQIKRGLENLAATGAIGPVPKNWDMNFREAIRSWIESELKILFDLIPFKDEKTKEREVIHKLKEILEDIGEYDPSKIYEKVMEGKTPEEVIEVSEGASVEEATEQFKEVVLKEIQAFFDVFEYVQVETTGKATAGNWLIKASIVQELPNHPVAQYIRKRAQLGDRGTVERVERVVKVAPKDTTTLLTKLSEELAKPLPAKLKRIWLDKKLEEFKPLPHDLISDLFVTLKTSGLFEDEAALADYIEKYLG